MAMEHHIFRPGAGQVLRRFVSGWTESAMYPHDWVGISSTANSGQGPGADGVLEGKTLGTNDFVYVVLAASGLDGYPGLELGVSMGNSINAVSDITDVGSDNQAADEVVVIQCWGVHPMVRTDDAAVVDTEYLAIGTDAGIADASGTIHASCGGDVGYALATDGAYTRESAMTGGAAFIRCNR